MTVMELEQILYGNVILRNIVMENSVPIRFSEFSSDKKPKEILGMEVVAIYISENLDNCIVVEVK